MKIAVRSTPSTSQNRSAEPSWSLIRLVAPTGMTKNSPIASTSEKKIVSPQVKPPISSSSSPSASCALAEIARALKPILRRLGERDHSADHRAIAGAVALRPGDDRLGGDVDAALRSPTGHRPGGDPAHHHALEHRLATDRRVAATATGFPSGIRSDWAARGRAPFVEGSDRRLNGPRLAPHGAGIARPGLRCQPASACPYRRDGTASRSPRAVRASWSACRSRSRTSSGRARGRIRDGYLSSSCSSLARLNNTTAGRRIAPRSEELTYRL